MNFSPIVATLTREEYEIATRSIRGKGGVQQRLRKILNALNHHTKEISVLPTDEAYMRDFISGRVGEGGYQGRFRCIIWAIDRARPVRRVVEADPRD